MTDLKKLEDLFKNFFDSKGVILDEPIDTAWFEEQQKMYEWGMNQYKTLFPAEEEE